MSSYGGLPGQLAYIRFEAPNAAPLVAGTTYTDARTYEHPVAGKPIVDFGRSAWNCEDTRTTFTVHSIAHDAGGRLSQLDLSFATSCPGGAVELVGEFRVNTPARHLRMVVSQNMVIPSDWADPGHAVTVGESSETRTVKLDGVGKSPVTLGQITFDGAYPDDWAVSADMCSGATLVEGESCTFGLTFVPTDHGQRAANILVPRTP